MLRNPGKLKRKYWRPSSTQVASLCCPPAKWGDTEEPPFTPVCLTAACSKRSAANLRALCQPGLPTDPFAQSPPDPPWASRHQGLPTFAWPERGSENPKSLRTRFASLPAGPATPRQAPSGAWRGKTSLYLFPLALPIPPDPLSLCFPSRVPSPGQPGYDVTQRSHG